MENISKKMILDDLENNDNITYQVLLLRLYDEYQKKETDLKSPQLIKIQNAYTIINNKLQTLDKREDYYQSEEIMNEILKQSKILDNSMLNCKIQNKEQIQKIIDLITILECYLKLNVSFKDNLEHCIKITLEKNKKHQKKAR